MQVWKESEGEEHSEELEQGLASLQEAAVAHEQISLQRSSSGTGAVLRTNFLLLLDTVSEQDGHLLTAEEAGVFQAYQACTWPSAASRRLSTDAKPYSVVCLMHVISSNPEAGGRDAMSQWLPESL